MGANLDSNKSDSLNPLTEAIWLEKVYQRNVPQLTVRAVVIGMLIGAVMCLSNLYVFFKAGWSMGVTITASILAFAFFKMLSAVGLAKQPLTLLENNALTTVSSGAGYMTGGGNMAAFGALMMITTVRPDLLPMVAWFGLIAALGVFVAIPIKRQLINKEALPFPTGTATAETLRAIHGTTEAEKGEGNRQAKALGYAAAAAALMAWFRDAKAAWMPFNIPGTLKFPFMLAGKTAAEWTLAINTEVLLAGAGALMSFRTAWSMALGAVLTYGFLAPALVAEGVVKTVSYKGIATATVWPGAAILVASGLATFIFDWRSVVRSFQGLQGLWGGSKSSEDPINAVECPGWWFPAGVMLLSPLVIWLMVALFQIPLWAALLAIPLAVAMGFIAARVTGETDITPTKAFGPVTQMTYGILTPGNLSGNIMSANVTAGIGLHAADLLTTLKTGWLVGGHPRVQFFAQLFGVFAGAIIVVPAFNLLFPDPSILGSEEWPAPACLVWAGVSQAFAGGISSISNFAKQGIIVGLLLGLALALLERFAPKALKPYIPSPSGLGIAMVIPASNSFAMAIGGSVAWYLQKRHPKTAAKYIVPVGSGLIAGESLMGVLVALLIVAGILAR